jgi:hypothetical protein
MVTMAVMLPLKEEMVVAEVVHLVVAEDLLM